MIQDVFILNSVSIMQVKIVDSYNNRTNGKSKKGLYINCRTHLHIISVQGSS